MFESQYPHHRFPRFIKILFALAPVAALVGCETTADFRLPDNRFVTPEIRGEAWSGRLNLLAYGSKTNVILARDEMPDVRDGVVTVDNAGLRKDDGFFLGADLSVERGVELFSINGGNGIKWQLTGDSEKTAKAGNLSVAVALGYDAGTRRNTKQKEEFGHVDTHSRVRYEVIDLMALAGFRLTDDALLYANLARARFRGTGAIHHIVSSVTGSVYEDYTIASPRRAGEQWSALIGLRAVDELGAFGALEGGFARTTMVGSESLTRPVFGVSTGVSW